MLHELRVENLLLVERAELRLAPGLNVLTGETGAGKTMLAHALDLLLGGRARSGLVRTGAAEAYVEGVFARPAELSEALRERIPDEAEELVVARRVWPDGRTRAYLCGRSATLAELRELGESLLSFYGQHEHRRLMLGAAQLEILDAHCGAPALALREEVARLHARVRALEGERDALGELAGARERELDLLGYELAEIEAAEPREGELDELSVERDRLRHLETLQLAAAAGAEALGGEPDGVGEVLARALGALAPGAAIDPALEPLRARLESLAIEAQDLAGELRRYEPGADAVPGRLEAVEDRLAAVGRLVRKYGGTEGEVLRHAAECRRRREDLERAEVTLEEVEAALGEALRRRDVAAGELRALRRLGAVELAGAVRERLAELAMPDAVFEVQVAERPEGCGPRGADSVELMIAPNPGIAAAPLREIASGGELSRVMLALLSVAHAGGGAAGSTLVFDEIDAGIGGHTARAVGEHLRELARGRQVLCITHLPQVAALGGRHFTIVKDPAARPARTTVRELAGEEVVGELVRMLGAGEDDAAAGEHARSLLRAA